MTQTRLCLGLGVWGGWLRSDLVRWSHLAWLVAAAGMTLRLAGGPGACRVPGLLL